MYILPFTYMLVLLFLVLSYITNTPKSQNIDSILEVTVSPSGMGPNTTQSTLTYPPAGTVIQPGEAKVLKTQQCSELMLHTSLKELLIYGPQST